MRPQARCDPEKTSPLPWSQFHAASADEGRLFEEGGVEGADVDDNSGDAVVLGKNRADTTGVVLLQRDFGV